MIYLLNATSKVISYVYTDEEGEFEFAGLGYGVYKLRAEITGNLSTVQQIQLDESNPVVDELILDIRCNSYVGFAEQEAFSGNITAVVYPQPAFNKLTHIGFPIIPTPMNPIFSIIKLQIDFIH